MKKMYAMLAVMCLSVTIAYSQCYPVMKVHHVSYSPVYGIDTMNIYMPIGAPSTPRPLLIMAHGGSFTAGDDNEHTSSEIARRFASRGYTTASISYRLESSPLNLLDSNVAAGAVMRAVGDMKAAIRFFKHDAFTSNLYNVDTTKVYVGGNSAGAIMAVNLAYLNDTNLAKPYIRTQIRANGGLEGNSGWPGYSTRVNGVINFAGAVKDSLWITPGQAKMISAHGDSDKTVPYNFGMVLTSLTGGGALHTITVAGSGAMKPRLDEMGIVNRLKTYFGSDHVPWESDPAKFDEIDTIAASFLGAPICFQLGVQVDVSGINDIAANAVISLYPNPATNRMTITSEDAIETINIVDKMGRVINTVAVSGTQSQIDLSGVSAGIYLAKINLKGNKGIAIRSFIVE